MASLLHNYDDAIASGKTAYLLEKGNNRREEGRGRRKDRMKIMRRWTLMMILLRAEKMPIC